MIFSANSGKRRGAIFHRHPARSVSVCDFHGLSRALAPAFLALIVVALAPAALAQQSARARELSLKLRCMCGGCEDTVGTCNHTGGAFSGPCPVAKTMMKEIDARIDRGESDDLILQDFVQEYGPTVLLSPPARGFDWLVWITPIVLPLFAILLIWEVVRRWRHRAALEVADGPPIPAELLDRARREATGAGDE